MKGLHTRKSPQQFCKKTPGGGRKRRQNPSSRLVAGPGKRGRGSSRGLQMHLADSFQRESCDLGHLAQHSHAASPASFGLPAPRGWRVQFILAISVGRQRMERMEDQRPGMRGQKGGGEPVPPARVTRVWCHRVERDVSRVKYELWVAGRSWRSSSRLQPGPSPSQGCSARVGADPAPAA